MIMNVFCPHILLIRCTELFLSKNLMSMFTCPLSVVAEPVRSQSLEEKRSRSLEDKPAEPKVDRHGMALFPCPSVIDSLCILLNQGPSHPVTSPSCVHPENFSRGGLTVFFKFARGHIFGIL